MSINGRIMTRHTPMSVGRILLRCDASVFVQYQSFEQHTAKHFDFCFKSVP